MARDEANDEQIAFAILLSRSFSISILNLCPREVATAYLQPAASTPKAYWFYKQVFK